MFRLAPKTFLIFRMTIRSIDELVRIALNCLCRCYRIVPSIALVLCCPLYSQEESSKGLDVQPAINENRATPVDKIQVAEGFEVELLYSVPGNTQGSWINLALDGKNRLIASDQYGGLYRFPAPNPGEELDPAEVKRIPVEIKGANGLLWAFDSLYVGVNDYENAGNSGLYRITDTDGDDQLDHVELLRHIPGRRGDHGVHGVLLSPDGESLYLICGNYTTLTEIDASRVNRYWGEDHLLPRLPDASGHHTKGMAPGGMVYEVSRDGSTWTLISIGYRNPFDGAFNAEGELFTYDADMERDFNTPWYRPTRINHVVSGTDYGWRNGTGKWAEWYVDSVPPALNIGPGSPTGVAFGYGAKFPAEYQNALFIQDWSWGKLYAVTFEPEGSSYKGSKKDFLSGVPLPMTDLLMHPDDGAMYFTIGGRRVQSGLYRVSYIGNEDTDPSIVANTGQKARDLRRRLEAFHGKKAEGAIDFAWTYLDDEDPFIRNAARVALESQTSKSWIERAFRERDSGKKIHALLALARVSAVDPFHRTPADLPVNRELGDRILTALADIDYGSLSERHRLAVVRTYQVALNRFDGAGESVRDAIIEQLDPYFPADTQESNRLLCEVLVYLQAPNAAHAGIALIKAAATQEEQVEYARSLRILTSGWTIGLRVEYFEWFLKAASYRGGSSFTKTIEMIRKDALATLTEREKTELADLLDRTPEIKTPLESALSRLAGRTQRTNWAMDDLSDASSEMSGRNFETGRAMFTAAACFSCHRFNNEGGAMGPDLSSAGGRYSPYDFLDQVINPSKEINEQYVPVEISMLDGTAHYGVVVNLNGDTIQINTDLADPAQRIDLDRTLIKNIGPSPVSPMPPGLLNLLTKEEIFDLVAYVLSGGNPEDERFR